ncbi:MAG: hypothetical protein A3G18_08870 [Rhodospirillales bacterium RIFCSPLOWO2_12_FULL_58_28]|nr:MAG: hypothetical protein A3H92_01465 [Rhodospirillales bacterium RIFCSPLOWO2_02_FULL_58_16]OHC78418.1 MAG: hypothetical protein A3G18_08870 [Rhodospirillales bacterium RIFCSPLOWO2_12_FULL_58_28]
MLRLVTSINWALGTLILGVAVMYALVGDVFISGGVNASAEAVVKNIAKAERDHYAQRERYVYFSADEIALAKAMTTLSLKMPPEDFRFEAFTDNDNALVVRAVTSMGTLRAGWVRPALYEYRIKSAADVGSGGWVNL